MSNFSKDNPSIRVFAPPGGRSTNIFGVPEPEPPVLAKKNHMESDIFGCKRDNTDSVPVKQTHNMTNNIFGNEREPTVQKSNVYSNKNKSTIFDEAPPQQPSTKPDRQRSNIFGANEPAQAVPARAVSEKFKSNIFGNADDDNQTKRQPGSRQGLRVGYNPINGESYSTKDGLNSKLEQLEIQDNEKESDDTVKTLKQADEEENGHKEESDKNSTNNGHIQESVETIENGNTQASVDKPTNGHANGTNGHSNGKNTHTSVRVFHPPGGRSNGPLW
ncbi:hypothetical protein I4U23_008625 [Adineta vaga]|nr:hypothetical protein I4U23_008625 [Adineta vaga]